MLSSFSTFLWRGYLLTVGLPNRSIAAGHLEPFAPFPCSQQHLLRLSRKEHPVVPGPCLPLALFPLSGTFSNSKTFIQIFRSAFLLSVRTFAAT